MKILLIYPPFPSGKGMGAIMCSPPLNILTLAGAIPEHIVDILDLNIDKSYGIKEMEKKLINYDLIGITCMSPSFRMVLNICKLAKRNKIQTILGGFHPTLDPSIIDRYDCINMVVRGEGEITFKELLSGKPKKEILGLSYRENGKVYHNPNRPFIKNLDELPFPRNELVEHEPYHYLWVPAWVCETSRGCPFSCRFCCVHEFYNRTYRTKTPERVIKELFQVPPKTKLIFFVDDNFTMHKKRIMRICELLQRTNLSKRFMFACQARVDDIADNPDMVKEMRKSGFICFFLGFESLKQMALDRMEKGYSLDKVRDCVKICHKNGIIAFGSFIVGNIGETKEDTRETFRLMRDIDIDFMMTSPITPFPGTQLFYEAVEKGWVEKDHKWENRKVGHVKPIMSTPDLTVDDIQELLSESYRSFYNKKFLLKKYSVGLLKYPKFKWVIKFAPKFILNGATKFLGRIDKIVDEEFQAI
ncbi:MAG: B12-binding domain-containing radical SAM protein [Candidatus Thorarchaeota archaeon]